MKFCIVVLSSPQAPSSRRALRFAEALLAAGQELVRLFFYQDGVYNASDLGLWPQDELNLGRAWRDFISAHRLDAVVCVAAANRRGLADADEARRQGLPGANVSPPWQLSGLGQLHDGIQEADRLVCFGGP